MLRADVTAESLHRAPGRLPAGPLRPRSSRGSTKAARRRAERCSRWMLAPNGFLHAASVLLLADTTAGYASIAHLPTKAKNFTTVELKSNFLGTTREGTIRSECRRRAPRPDDARLVGDGVRSRRSSASRCFAARSWSCGERADARAASRAAPAVALAPAPLGDREIDALQALLDAVPAPLEPLDVSSLDGFLCGVIVQPARSRRRAGCASSPTSTAGRCRRASTRAPLHALVLRREAELRRAIDRREWFDPWVFELDPTRSDDGGDGDGASERPGLSVGRRLRRRARDLSRPARRRRSGADRAAGAALSPSRRRRSRGRRHAARRDRGARAAGRPRRRGRGAGARDLAARRRRRAMACADAATARPPLAARERRRVRSSADRRRSPSAGRAAARRRARRCSASSSGSQARSIACRRWRDADSTSICIRSMSATRATSSGTGA